MIPNKWGDYAVETINKKTGYFDIYDYSFMFNRFMYLIKPVFFEAILYGR